MPLADRPGAFMAGVNDSAKVSVSRPLGGPDSRALPAPGRERRGQGSLF